MWMKDDENKCGPTGVLMALMTVVVRNWTAGSTINQKRKRTGSGRGGKKAERETTNGQSVGQTIENPNRRMWANTHYIEKRGWMEKCNKLNEETA